MKTLLLLLLMLITCQAIHAQTVKSGDGVNKIEDNFKIFIDSLNVQGLPPFDNSDTLQKAYIDYSIYSFNHRKRAFQWQYDSSRIIFWLVISILVTGLILSILQFIQSYRNLHTSKGDDTEMKLSPTELSIKSSVLGIIILFISIAFFYLYLMIVYPISVVP